MVDLILNHGADINDRSGDADYSSLHILASCPGDIEGICPYFSACLMLWLVKKGANVNILDNNDKNVLHILGKFGGCALQMKVMLDTNINVHHLMRAGWSTLKYVEYY